MHQIEIYQAKTQLSRLLSRVADGEEIIIAQAGKPVAKLVPFEKPVRVIGQDIGLFDVPENFDDSLPEEILKDFGL